MILSPTANQIAKLEGLGFSEGDCVAALEETKGQIEEAAGWLLENATPEPPQAKNGQAALDISGYEVPYGHYLQIYVSKHAERIPHLWAQGSSFLYGCSLKKVEGLCQDSLSS